MLDHYIIKVVGVLEQKEKNGAKTCVKRLRSVMFLT